MNNNLDELIKELEELQKDVAFPDRNDIIINEKSLSETLSFIKYYFSNNTEIEYPYYADIHPDGMIALMWHKNNVGIAGIVFEGKDENIIWSYYIENGENDCGTIKIGEFDDSVLKEILKNNFKKDLEICHIEQKFKN